MEENELELTESAMKNPLVGGVPKNFRQQADMEAFYRFVYDNDLRAESIAIMDKLREQKALQKVAKKKH